MKRVHSGSEDEPTHSGNTRDYYSFWHHLCLRTEMALIHVLTIVTTDLGKRFTFANGE